MIASPDCTVATLVARDCPLDTLPSPRWRCCMAPTTVGVGVHTHITSAGVHDLVALVRDLVALVVHPWRAAPPLRAQNGSEAKMAHCLGNPLNYLGPPLNYLGPLLNYVGPLLNYVGASLELLGVSLELLGATLELQCLRVVYY